MQELPPHVQDLIRTTRKAMLLLNSVDVTILCGALSKEGRVGYEAWRDLLKGECSETVEWLETFIRWRKDT